MNDYIAYCGLDCEICEARLATINDDNELRIKVSKEWSRLNGVEITPEMINCSGCRLPGEKTIYCDTLCPIRQCAKEKQMETCGGCSEMKSCEKVRAIIGNNPDARSRLENAVNYKVVDKEKYYRSGVFRHFTQDCKCSTSMTARIDVTDLVEYSRRSGTKFYINFLYVLSKVLNSRDDYRMGYLWQSEELICYDSINPIQYVFHEDTDTCTPVYTTYYEDYEEFYRNAVNDIENAKKKREYGLDMMNHPNWFDASYISWLSYDSLNVELPDGYLHFAPIINWCKYRHEGGRLMMPVTVRLNHAIADGFLVANVYRLLEKEIIDFCNSEE